MQNSPFDALQLFSCLLQTPNGSCHAWYNDSTFGKDSYSKSLSKLFNHKNVRHPVTMPITRDFARYLHHSQQASFCTGIYVPCLYLVGRFDTHSLTMKIRGDFKLVGSTHISVVRTF